MIAAQVVVKKQVDAWHPAGGEMTPAQTGVDLGTIVCSVKGMLAEEQIIGFVIPRMQEVELRIFQAEIFIHTQRDFRSAKVI